MIPSQSVAFPYGAADLGDASAPAAPWLVVPGPRLRPTLPRATGGRVFNLTFHGVGRPRRALDDGEDSVWLATEEFVRILDAVGERPDVRLTFDDGNPSDLDVVAPQLRRHGRIGWFFVPAERVGAPGFLDARGLRALLDAGMVVGSHGMRHRPWAGLSDEELREEVVDAKDRLEQLVGSAVHEAACPFGSYDRRSLSLLRAAGFMRVYTSDGGAASPCNWLQARRTVRRNETAEDVLRVVDTPPHPLAGLERFARLAVKRWR